MKQPDKQNQNSLINPCKKMLGLLLLCFFLFFKVNVNAQDEKESIDKFAMDIFNAFQNSDILSMFTLFKTPEESFEVFKKQGYSINEQTVQDNSLVVAIAYRNQIDKLFEECKERKIAPANSVYVEHTMILPEKTDVPTVHLIIKAKCGLIEFTLRAYDCEKVNGRWTLMRAPNLKRVYDADSSFNDFPLTLIETLKNHDNSAYKAHTVSVSNIKAVLTESTYDDYEKKMILESIREDSISDQSGSDYDSLMVLFLQNNFDLKNATVTVDECFKFTEKGIERGKFSCLLTSKDQTCRIESEIDCIKTPDGWKIIGRPKVIF